MESEVRQREIEKLNEIYQLISIETSLEEVLQIAYNYLLENYGIDALWLTLVDDPNQRLYTHHAKWPGKTQEIEAFFNKLIIPLNPEGGTLYKTYQKQRPLFLPSIRKSRITDQNSWDSKIVKTLNLSNLISIPLLVRGEMIGIICMSSHEQKLKFKRKYLKSLNRFCNQIAGKIYATKLYENAQGARKEAEMARDEIKKLSEITQKLNAYTNLEEILSGILTHLKDNYGIDSIWLLQTDESEEYLHTSHVISDGINQEQKDYLRNLLIPLNDTGGSLWQTYKKRKTFCIIHLEKILSRLKPKTKTIDLLLIENLKLKSTIQIPMIIKDRVVGILNLTSIEKKLNLKRISIESIQRFCDGIMGAVNTTRLYEQAEQVRKVLEKELRMAQEIQVSLLPLKQPRIPGAIISHLYAPMLEVGGDFYDLHYKKEDKRLGFFICDVSGHGVPAAFLASMVKMSLQNWGDYLGGPAKNLLHTEKLLHGKMAGNTLTACTGYLDLESGLVRFARAGHPPLILLRQSGEMEMIRPTGRIIADADWLSDEITESNFTMKSGDKLILYTDGITEEPNAKGEFLEDEGFHALLRKYYQDSPENICAKIHEAILEYTGSRNLVDDVTLVVIEYLGLD